MNEASVGAEFAGSIDFGLISPAIENPTAIRTLMAVTSEAILMVTDGDESGVIENISQALGITPLDVICRSANIIVYYHDVGVTFSCCAATFWRPNRV
jgi:hypothetical protein